jgi:hypothetical protein
MAKININGVTREMTAEEMAKFEKSNVNMPSLEPTPEERLAALEKAGLERDAALMELAAMLAGGI